MKPLSDFYPQVQPYISNVPAPTMDLALVTSAIRFCEDARVLVGRVDPISTIAGVNEYQLDPPAQQRVVTVKRAWLDGSRIRPFPKGGTPPPNTTTGQPTHFYTRIEGSTAYLVLYPTPDKVYTVEAESAYAPTRSATTLDDNLYELWIDALRAGTLAFLHAIPGQPFSDMVQAAAAGTAFLMHTGKAKRTDTYGATEGAFQVTQRPIT